MVVMWMGHRLEKKSTMTMIGNININIIIIIITIANAVFIDFIIDES